MRDVDVVSDLSDDDLIASYHAASRLLIAMEATTANNAVAEIHVCCR